MAKPRIFVVPHTHYDAEVFLTRDVTLKLGSDHILDMLYLLEREPNYRFVLDQRAYLEGFASLYPEQLDRLKTHIRSGRVEVVGGMHIMPDVNMPSGESSVRQILYGRSYLDDVLGGSVRTGWMIDTFGHHPQMPQIMRKAGFDHYVFGRGMWVHDKAAFWWVGIDGSRLRCEWLPYLYGVLGMAPDNLPAFREIMENHWNAWKPYLYNDQLMAPAGADLAAPDAHLPDLLRRYNASQSDVELVLATPREYFRAQANANLGEIQGDFNPIFVGCYASRIALKQNNRRMENALLSAEKLMAINWAQSAKPPDALTEAWEPVLFNQFHDVLCGCHVDAVYERAMDRYKRAGKGVALTTEKALDALTSQINTQGDGIPLVVFNLLALPRKDVAQCTIGLASEGWDSVALFDEEGNQVPLQLEAVQRHADGSIKRADLLFVAQVPSLGYRTYFLREGSGVQPTTDLWIKQVGGRSFGGCRLGIQEPDHGRMGNGLVEVEASLRTGSIGEILLRTLDWDVVNTGDPRGFATVCRQEDRGDLWEYYGPLRGSVSGAVPLVDPVPQPDQALFSRTGGGQGWAVGGPVMAEIGVNSPMGDGEFRIRLRLYAGLPRLEIITELVNQQPFVRYRNVFPCNLSDPKITYEIPFGAYQRPEGEYAAQNWVDVSDGAKGIALLNRGIPGHSLVGHTLTASLMKCSRLVSYPEHGGYSKAATSETGFEIGVTHRFEQALIPHEGDWRSAKVYHDGWAFNVPLIVRKMMPRAGTLPSSASFLQVEPDTFVLHAMYVEDGHLILRLTEAAGVAPDSAQIRLPWPVADAVETDLLGNVLGPAESGQGNVHFTAGPYEIKTFRIALAQGT